MKVMNTLTKLFFLSLFVSTFSYSQESKPQMNVEEMTVIKETSIDVPTIKCGSCVKTVSSVLKKLDGVKEVNVDKKTKKASVKYDSEKVKIADMESAISKAGYDANEMKKDEKAYEELDDCCK